MDVLSPHICNRRHRERLLFLDQSLPRDSEKPLHSNPLQFLWTSANQAPWCHTTSWGQRITHTQHHPSQGWQEPSAPAQRREFIRLPRRYKLDQSHLSWQPQPKQGVMERSQESSSKPGQESPREQEEPSAELGSSQQGWTGILPANTGQSACNAINNSWEAFGSHRAIYVTTLFQLVEQVELLLKGTFVLLLGPSSPAPRAGLAGAFAQQHTHKVD